ncbi:MAG: hypothetical protein V8R51_06575 [Clostridia bacterium]
MKKKMFVAMTLAMVTILATLTGCTIRSSYDERIINSAEKPGKPGLCQCRIHTKQEIGFLR